VIELPEEVVQIINSEEKIGSIEKEVQVPTSEKTVSLINQVVQSPTIKGTISLEEKFIDSQINFNQWYSFFKTMAIINSYNFSLSTWL
jgi:hypothetical protein